MLLGQMRGLACPPIHLSDIARTRSRCPRFGMWRRKERVCICSSRRGGCCGGLLRTRASEWSTRVCREQADALIRLPKPRGLLHGDRVRIREGPFANLIAVYAGMSGAQRVAVLLALFGGEKRVTLPKNDVVAL